VEEEFEEEDIVDYEELEEVDPFGDTTED